MIQTNQFGVVIVCNNIIGLALFLNNEEKE